MDNTFLSNASFSRASASPAHRRVDRRRDGSARCFFTAIFTLALMLTGFTSPLDVAYARGETATAEVTGIVIDLGPTGEAVFDPNSHYVARAPGYTLETFLIEYDTTIVMIDVMSGNLDVDGYMAVAEADIAATYDYMDWLGGEWSLTHS